MFLMALGAGGISVSGFAFLNYTVPHGKGLITYAMLHAKEFSLLNQLLFRFVESYMVVFTLIHFALTAFLIARYLKWKKSEEYKQVLENPLVNSSLLVPFVSFFMTFNVVIGTVRYFLPVLSDNLQSLMMPALIAWAVLLVVLVGLEMKLLSMAFVKKFDFTKMNFGWLMHPFALGMGSVTGTGIAAMAVDPSVAHAAAFISMVTFTMAVFLLAIKIFILFKNSLSGDGLPENQFLPSMLMIVPILTIFGISLFRYGHYFERQFGAHMGPYFAIVTVLTFAFQTWYLIFGLTLLKKFLVKDFRKEYHISQWGLVCPFVAFAVMGSFVFANFLASQLLLIIIVLTTFVFVFLYFYLLVKQFKCNGLSTNDSKTICA